MRALTILVLLLLATVPAAASAAAGVPEELERLEQREDRLRADRQAAATSLVDLHIARDAAEEGAAAALDQLREHLVALYKAGDSERMAMLIEARDVRDVLDRGTLVSQLVRHDRRIVQQWHDALDAVELAEMRVDAAADEIAGIDARLERLAERIERFERPTGPVDLDKVEVVDADLVFTTGAIPEVGYWGGAMDPVALLASLVPDGGDRLPDGYRPTGQVDIGIASWYGPGFHGKNTASGEVYDQFAMTAAHRQLPLGTWVKVVGSNGRSVVVRINDRGPFIEGRIIDLSKAAAQRLEMSGTMAVQVQVLSPGGERVALEPAPDIELQPPGGSSDGDGQGAGDAAEGATA